MENTLELEVTRDLKNRFLNLPDDGPMALEAHILRKQTLHELLDSQDVVTVIDWGDTDDTRPHETVWLVLYPIVGHLVIEGFKKLGEKLLDKGIDESTSALVKWIIHKFSKKVEEGKIGDFSANLKNGLRISGNLPVGGSIRIYNENTGESIVIERDGK